MSNRIFRCLAVCAALAAPFAPATAATYPDKPVRIVVNFPAGGPLDVVARLLAKQAGDKLGGTVVVDNRAGASGNIGAESVARAAPDGYTLLMTLDTLVTVNPSAFRQMTFDPATDLVPIGLAGEFTQVLVTHPSLQTPDYAAFVTRAKAEDLSYASAGVGSPGHLPYELLKEKAGIQGTHVAYRGNAPALIDLVGGQVPVGFLALPTALSFIESGKLVPLLVPGQTRQPLLPNVPSAAEVGLKDFDVGFAFVLMTPKGTPESVRSTWEKILADTFADASVRTTLVPLAITPVSTDAARATTWLKTAADRWHTVIERGNIRLD
ncbi:tripartite tricarboxylate transporter substrate binding protein [Achromobacter sp. GG226]|uniref:Bug family tripartite tricarboxylate transporter substrate binding protein n=1 Tax=Verticiella alkaliphila TaxID=2779529 RepID=UPI001C0B8EBA|nr:tripartite tricarboxylate transporter substrate binding protein [Verticiella sp. GG226]MBU4611102.1 tripartite tricarboxylate transporter substrate binding protein [Verticiella sp. GG226]